jgi:hypothetical protein
MDATTRPLRQICSVSGLDFLIARDPSRIDATRGSLPTGRLLVTYRISVSHVRANERNAALPAEYTSNQENLSPKQPTRSW